MGLDRHDTGNNGNRDASLSALPFPSDKGIDIVKQLGDNEIRSGIYLLLEVYNIFGFVLRVNVSLRVTRYGDAKVIPIFLSNVADQINCMTESIIAWSPVFLSARWVASQG